MIVDDQAAVLTFLSDPAHYPNARSVERLDTHTASVFLAGDRAYKLKRAVRYDYLDYSTVELRRAACEAEVRLNRRTAPRLYRGILPVTRADGELAIDGKGEPLDWLVVMERFPQEQMLDRLAQAHQLTVDTVLRLADHVAAFHRMADTRYDYGGAESIARVIDGNRDALLASGDVLDRDVVARVDRRSREWLDRHRTLLDSRRASGMVRQCHGDLHLRNIVLIDGQPTLFDGIEFNDDFAAIDVMYDLAFLLMDLLARDLPAHASSVFNRYLLRTSDYEGTAVLPLFLSCRAAIRCKTSLAAAALSGGEPRVADLHDRARRYLELACRLIDPAPGCVIAIGGFSGTGKSTLALRLAPSIGSPPGAVVLRTDEVRRQLFAAAPGQALPERAYTPANRKVVYAQVQRYARRVLDGGYSVIVDGVFADADERRDARRLAERGGVPFVGLWLQAEAAVLEQRLRQRRGDVSDATVAVMRRQRESSVPPDDWWKVDASGSPGETEAHARAAIAKSGSGAKNRAKRDATV